MRTVEVGCVVDPVKKWNPRREGTGAFTYVDISSIDQRTKTVFEPSSVDAAEAPSRARQLIAAGDVLVSTVRPNLNAVAYVKPALDGATASTGYCVLRPRPSDLDGRYLFHWVRAAPFVAHLVQRATGASYPAVSDKIVKAAPIPLPPIEEQRRIAAVLDAAETLRAMRRQALAKLDDLTQAVFVDIFGDPLHPDAETVALVDTAEIVMGQSPPGDTYNEQGDGVPLLNGPAEFGDEYPVPVQWTTAPTRMSKAGDILFCVRGATAGRLNWSDVSYCLGRGLAAIRTEAPRRAFLFHVLDALYSRFQSRGVGSTFINISKADLQGVRVPAANSHLMLQHEQAHSKMSAQRTVMQASLSRLDTLFASLQQRAFRGEL